MVDKSEIKYEFEIYLSVKEQSYSFRKGMGRDKNSEATLGRSLDKRLYR